jgi:hypothetical protein
VADAGGGEGDDAGDAGALHCGHEGAGGIGVEAEGAPAGRADRGDHGVVALHGGFHALPVAYVGANHGERSSAGAARGGTRRELFGGAHRGCDVVPRPQRLLDDEVTGAATCPEHDHATHERAPAASRCGVALPWPRPARTVSVSGVKAEGMRSPQG